MGLGALIASVVACGMLLGSAQVNSAMFTLAVTQTYLLLPTAFFLLVGIILQSCGTFGLAKAREIEQTPMIMFLNAIIILVLALVVIGAVIASVIHIQGIDDRIEKNLLKTLKVAAKDSTSSEMSDWDEVQRAYECCGGTDAGDWIVEKEASTWNVVPASCGSTEDEQFARKGCTLEVQTAVLQFCLLIIAVLMLVAGSLLINVALMMFIALKSAGNPDWLRLRDEPDDADEEIEGEEDTDEQGLDSLSRERSVLGTESVILASKTAQIEKPVKSKLVVVS